MFTPCNLLVRFSAKLLEPYGFEMYTMTALEYKTLASQIVESIEYPKNANMLGNSLADPSIALRPTVGLNCVSYTFSNFESLFD